MSRTHGLVVLITVGMLVTTVAQAGTVPKDAEIRTVAYRGVPVRVTLPLDEEIRVHVDESVEVGMPVSLATKLDVASVHGVVYLTALKAFTSQRLALKASQTGRFILLDVSSIGDANTPKDIFIRTGGKAVFPEVQAALTTTQLIRYIAQATLAPRRAASIPSQFKRSIIAIPPNRIYRDYAVASTLLAAWRTETWLALAVELRNQSDRAVVLSPDDIAGVWIAVGFQHVRLLPQGKRGARTVIFLVGVHDAIDELQH